MAIIFAQYDLNMRDLNFSRFVKGFVASRFIPEFFIEDAEELVDLYWMDWQISGYTKSSVFSGQNFKIEQRDTVDEDVAPELDDVFVSGTVDDYYEFQYYEIDGAQESTLHFLISGMQLSLLDFTSAWRTPDTTDDYRQLAIALSKDDVIYGSIFNDILLSYAGNDYFFSSGGSDLFDGGDGIDLASFSGRRLDYQISVSDAKFIVADSVVGRDGVAELVDVERLRFLDNAVALDINDNAGEAYRLYEAAFNRKPDAEGLGYWIAQLDKGLSLKSVAEGFLGSAEFQSLYGSSPTNAAFVDNLYKNILDRAGEKAGVDYWIGQLNKGVSRADVLIGFSESEENKAGVIGSIQNGIEYKEWLG